MTNSVVVTGAGGGIGSAVCKRLARSGWFVVALEVDPARASVLRSALRGDGIVFEGDVCNRTDIATASELAREDGRSLRAWVNNVGIARESPLHETTAEEFAAVMMVNLGSYFWGCQEAVRAFLQQGVNGAIVNVSSVHGRVGYSGWASYDTAKGGVDALTRYVAVEYGPVGIRANGVAPGAVSTPMSQAIIQQAPDPVAFELGIAMQSPMRRISDPAEVAAVIEFLLGEQAAFVTGQTIAVDGGLTAAAMPFPNHPSLTKPVNG